MPIRIYRMTSVATTTSVGQAATTIVAKGRIKQAVLTASYVGGAGNGRLTFEAALNNTANGNAETATGAPSELLIARLSTCVPPTSSASNNAIIPCDIPVMPGNIVCINVLQAVGTAPANGLNGVDLHVME